MSVRALRVILGGRIPGRVLPACVLPICVGPVCALGPDGSACRWFPAAAVRVLGFLVELVHEPIDHCPFNAPLAKYLKRRECTGLDEFRHLVPG
jgi:hypothetical protein